MANIVLRSVKGSPLTIDEADANFTNLNTEVGQKLDADDFNAETVLGLLGDYDEDGDGQGLNAATVLAKQIDEEETPDTIALRDASGDIYAVRFWGNLSGNVTGNVVGDVTGNLTGNASNVTGTVALNNGGTGGTTASEARTNLGIGEMATQDPDNVQITGGSISGISDIAISDGGTGASNAAAARVNLGLVIGQDVQPFNNGLTAFSSLTTNGIVVKTSSGAAASRKITASGNVSVTNGDGISGDIALVGTQTPTITSITKGGTNGTGNIGQSDNKFGTIYGTATSATYADLAEKYLPDADYPVGTVMTVGGEKEVTACRAFSRAIGVISENPAYMMNSELEGGVYVALKGRVPVRVVGPCSKGDELVPSEDGNAYATDGGKVFAVALEDKSGAEVKLVEAVIL
jgi:hypothetical protein